MRILDVITSPWAILPEKLREIQAIYATHLKGDKINIKGIEAQIGRPLNNETTSYQVIDNVAIVELNGIIAKRMNLFTQISGGVSTQIAIRDFQQAFNDPGVTAIILSIDSPGGTVDGTEELANTIYEARQTEAKPIIAYCDGSLCSGAYWIGAAADRIYINGSTQQVGSVGVVATHVDYSEQEKKEGIKTTEIFAGKYKRINTEYAPLTEEGRAYMQDRIDYFYSIFVNTMIRYRPNKLAIPKDGVIPWAEGKVFIGQQAIDNGLVDGVKPLEELIQQLSQEGRTMLIQEQIKEDMERRKEDSKWT